jgi:glucan phosphoethanolaminetransferase (alkaline phosphatase superfamily)
MYLEKIILIIVNINKNKNKSLISNQFSLKNDLWSFLTFYLRKIVLQEMRRTSFLRENWFEMSDLFSSLLIFLFALAEKSPFILSLFIFADSAYVYL